MKKRWLYLLTKALYMVQFLHAPLEIIDMSIDQELGTQPRKSGYDHENTDILTGGRVRPLLDFDGDAVTRVMPRKTGTAAGPGTLHPGPADLQHSVVGIEAPVKGPITQAEQLAAGGVVDVAPTNLSTHEMSGDLHTVFIQRIEKIIDTLRPIETAFNKRTITQAQRSEADVLEQSLAKIKKEVADSVTLTADQKKTLVYYLQRAEDLLQTISSYHARQFFTGLSQQFQVPARFQMLIQEGMDAVSTADIFGDEELRSVLMSCAIKYAVLLKAGKAQFNAVSDALSEQMEKLNTFLEKRKASNQKNRAALEKLLADSALPKTVVEKIRANSVYQQMLKTLEQYANWDISSEQSTTKMSGLLDRLRKIIVVERHKVNLTELLTDAGFSEDALADQEEYQKIMQEMDVLQEAYTRENNPLSRDEYFKEYLDLHEQYTNMVRSARIAADQNMFNQLIAATVKYVSNDKLQQEALTLLIKDQPVYKNIEEVIKKYKENTYGIHWYLGERETAKQALLSYLTADVVEVRVPVTVAVDKNRETLEQFVELAATFEKALPAAKKFNQYKAKFDELNKKYLSLQEGADIKRSAVLLKEYNKTAQALMKDIQMLAAKDFGWKKPEVAKETPVSSSPVIKPALQGALAHTPPANKVVPSADGMTVEGEVKTPQDVLKVSFGQMMQRVIDSKQFLGLLENSSFKTLFTQAMQKVMDRGNNNVDLETIISALQITISNHTKAVGISGISAFEKNLSDALNAYLAYYYALAGKAPKELKTSYEKFAKQLSGMLTLEPAKAV